MRMLEDEDWQGLPPLLTFRAVAERVYGGKPTRAQVEAVRRASHRLAEMGDVAVGRLNVLCEPFERRRPDRVETVTERTTGVVCRPLADHEWPESQTVIE